MKVKLTLLAAVLSLAATAQMTVTSEGKKVEALNCNMKNVKISMPLPENYKGYDRIRFLVSEHEFEGSIAYNYVYKLVYEVGHFVNSSNASFQLVDKAGTDSDFGNGASTFTLTEACYDGNRDFTELTVSVKIEGGTASGWTTNFDGDVVRDYKYQTLKTYSIKHKLGPVMDVFYGPLQAFTVKKIAVGEQNIEDYGDKFYIGYNGSSGGESDGTIDMSGPAPAATNGSLMMNAKVFKAGQVTEQDVVNGVQKYLFGLANVNFQPGGTGARVELFTNRKSEMLYLPAVITGAKKKEQKSDAPKTGLAKFKALANEMTAPKVTKTEMTAMVKEAEPNIGSLFSWKAKKIGNLEMKVLEGEMYQRDQQTSTDIGVKKVKAGQEENTRTVRIYVGQKGDYIYCIALYKIDTKGLTAAEAAYFKNFESTFTAL